jgi:riboflavin synthase
MFTGIVQGTGTVVAITHTTGYAQFVIDLPPHAMRPEIGASISLAGTCMTVVAVDDSRIIVDAMTETLAKTTLREWEIGTRINVERSARFGDEIGGHILSGHITTTAQITAIEHPENNHILELTLAPQYMKYLFPKGFIALAGASLTIVGVKTAANTFTVHLIPETLRATTFASHTIGDFVNVEFDTVTQTIVDTVERIFLSQQKV